MAQAVARRYAEALLTLARESNKIEQLDEQSKALAELFEQREIRAFFTAPMIPAERKKQALEKSLRGKADPVLINLGKLLIDKGRFGFMAEVMREFDRLTDELRGVEEVTISSAEPLSDAQREEITQGLLRFAAYGKLRVNTRIEPELLGGVRVQLGSQVLDGTVANRLSEMREKLTLPSWRT